MKRILVVQQTLRPPGGGSCVAAWVLQALRDEHRLTLLSWQPPDLDGVNRYFGTSLEPGDFELRLPPAGLRQAVKLLPTPSALLILSSLNRLARRLLHRGAFDLALSTENEMDFGRRGIQYIHFPSGYLPRPESNIRWYHRIPLLLTGYRSACAWVSGKTAEGIRKNLTLVNSDWTGTHFREHYGAEPLTVYPPVPGDFPNRPWAERRDGFVAIGRLSPEKELEKIIAILATVRRRGWPVELHIAGSPDHPMYTRKILALVDRESSWVRVHLDLPRDRLLHLVAGNRYGIHGMVGEHFGIAVAELVRGGSIVFVPDQGGSVEIVGQDPRLLYRSSEEAVAKIEGVLKDSALQASLRRDLAVRGNRFSAERFVAEIRHLVAGFHLAR